MSEYELIQGDCLEILPTLPAASVQCCVTSPPYFGLRDYGVSGQIGLEPTIGEYVAKMTAVFREVWRVLKPNGVLWLNLGDSYANDDKWGGATSGKRAQGLHGETGVGRTRKATGLPSKNLIGIPWRVAFALQEDGWILRSDCIWAKPNPMPESVTDRPTRSHEYIFLFAKQGRYYYNAEAIREPAAYPDDDRKARAKPDNKEFQDARHARMNPHTDKQRGHSRRHDGFNDRWDNMTKAEQGAGMRNKRDVWTVAPSQFAEAHFATFPPDLIEPCILAGSAPGDTVLDPFSGSGTTAAVALKHHRQAIGIELNKAYLEMAHNRIGKTQYVLPIVEAK